MPRISLFEPEAVDYRAFSQAYLRFGVGLAAVTVIEGMRPIVYMATELFGIYLLCLPTLLAPLCFTFGAYRILRHHRHAIQALVASLCIILLDFESLLALLLVVSGFGFDTAWIGFGVGGSRILLILLVISQLHLLAWLWFIWRLCDIISDTGRSLGYPRVPHAVRFLKALYVLTILAQAVQVLLRDQVKIPYHVWYVPKLLLFSVLIIILYGLRRLCRQHQNHGKPPPMPRISLFESKTINYRAYSWAFVWLAAGFLLTITFDWYSYILVTFQSFHSSYFLLPCGYFFPHICYAVGALVLLRHHPHALYLLLTVVAALVIGFLSPLLVNWSLLMRPPGGLGYPERAFMFAHWFINAVAKVAFLWLLCGLVRDTGRIAGSAALILFSTLSRNIAIACIILTSLGHLLPDEYWREIPYFLWWRPGAIGDIVMLLLILFAWRVCRRQTRREEAA